MLNMDLEIDFATTLERRILAAMYYSGFSQTPRPEKETTRADEPRLLPSSNSIGKLPIEKTT
jgi:hypothetical protein